MGRRGKFSNASGLQENETVNVAYLGVLLIHSLCSLETELTCKDHLS